jgi:hypothetical protein
MALIRRLYGSGPLHLVGYVASFAVAYYAATGLFRHQTIRVAVWFAGSAIAHDLLVLPLYGIADLALTQVWRRHEALGGVTWLNYVRFPFTISAVLLLIYFPEISRQRTAQLRDTGLTNHPYLDHWLGISAGLILVSAGVFAVRVLAHRRSTTQANTQRR